MANSIAGCFTLELYRTCKPSVIAFPGDDVSHPPTRVFHVSVPTGDQVDMAVEYRLPRRGADVYPDIESGNSTVFPLDFVLRPQEKIVASFHLRGVQFEQIRNMAFRDNQGVERGYRVPVPDGERELILCNGVIFNMCLPAPETSAYLISSRPAGSSPIHPTTQIRGLPASIFVAGKARTSPVKQNAVR